MGLRAPGSKRGKRRSIGELEDAGDPLAHPWDRAGLTRAERVILFLESLPCTKGYGAGAHLGQVFKRWRSADAFVAMPDARAEAERYVIMMPLPNVTAPLHMGHAMNNVLQDLLIRWQRMLGKNTLWQPGTSTAMGLAR